MGGRIEKMREKFTRSQMLFGKEAMEKIYKSRVVVLGLGGVGGQCCEALIRGGVGTLVVVDNDVITESNINRQLFATEKTVGVRKTSAAYERLKSINSEAEIIVRDVFINDETLPEIITSDTDFVVDCIDTVTSKLQAIKFCTDRNIPVISSMGTGNKLDPTRLEITDVFKTSVCPLAKVMRYELRKRGITKLPVLYSKEEPIVPFEEETMENTIKGEMKKKRSTPGSVSFVPPVAGIILASYVLRKITGVI